jgi:hypothetical protein
MLQIQPENILAGARAESKEQAVRTLVKGR